MLETYLLLESIAKTYEEIVLETKILKLPSGETSKLRIELVDGVLQMCGFLFLESIHTTGIDVRSMEQYIVMIMHHINPGHM